jgi:hypothetical protein
MATIYNPGMGRSLSAASADPFHNWNAPSYAPVQQGTQVYGDGAPVAGAAVKPMGQMDLLERAYADYEKRYAAANAENLRRDARSLSLVGLDADGKPVPGWNPYSATPAAAPAPVVPFSGQIPRPELQSKYEMKRMGPGGVLTTVPSNFGKVPPKADPNDPARMQSRAGMSASAYGRAAADYNNSAVSRGIYNSSGALNRQASLDSAERTASVNSMADRAFRSQQAAREQQDQLLQQRLGLLVNRTDLQPDSRPIIQAAAMLGSGSQEGIDPSAYSGGYGGSGGFVNSAALGYGIPAGAYGMPTGGGYQSYSPTRRGSPAALATADKIRKKQAAYAANLKTNAPQSTAGFKWGVDAPSGMFQSYA